MSDISCLVYSWKLVLSLSCTFACTVFIEELFSLCYGFFSNMLELFSLEFFIIWASYLWKFFRENLKWWILQWVMCRYTQWARLKLFSFLRGIRPDMEQMNKKRLILLVCSNKCKEPFFFPSDDTPATNNYLLISM